MESTQLNRTDLQILKILQETGRMTIKELAQKVHLSPTPVYERVRRLEADGVIEHYSAVLNAAKLGQGFIVFCSVKLLRMGKDIAIDFVETVRNIPEVAECYNISGEYDYLLKIYAPDMRYYNEFCINILGTIKSLGSIQSSFVMNSVKTTSGIPLR